MDERRLSVCDSRVLKRILGPKKKEVTEGWRKLHNQLHNLYSSTNINLLIISRRMRLAGHVARWRRRGMHTDYWWENTTERGGKEEQDVGE
jgi:hypothetical protein